MRLDWLRISRGPCRAPGRLVVPPSQGMPTSAMSSPAAEVTAGSRMKVDRPAKRGTTAASTGWWKGVVILAPRSRVAGEVGGCSDGSMQLGPELLHEALTHRAQLRALSLLENA